MQCYNIICICISYNYAYKYIQFQCIQCTHVVQAAQDEQEVTICKVCVHQANQMAKYQLAYLYRITYTHTFTVSKTAQRRAVSSGVLRLQTKAWILIFWLYFYCTSDPIRRHLTLKQEYIVYI